MKIKKVTWQLRRDFKADYECEHCGNVESRDGYDDEYFHRHIIPEMKCSNCGEKSPKGYRPLAPIHPEGKQL